VLSLLRRSARRTSGLYPEQALNKAGPAVELAQHRIAVAGDVGHPSVMLDRTVAVIAMEHERRPFDAIVLLGDNIYPDGDPERLKEAVLDPLKPILSRGVILHAVVGNHDVYRGLGDEVARGLGMPARWYERRFGNLQLIALDSTCIHSLDQKRWLIETLSRNRPAFRIVALHHPPYSAGWHGSSRDVRRALGPLFRRYGVDLVLAGHEHDYQRSKPIKGTVYVISGAATHLRPTGYRRFTAAAYALHHFIDMLVFEEHVVIRAIGHDGRSFDQAILPISSDVRTTQLQAS
jgi:3',5'-cyclic AMP phosphodiesterase CpdA